MGCAAHVDALEARLSGAVSGPEQEALDAHLSGCADCRAYLEVAARAEQLITQREAVPLPVPREAAPLASAAPAARVVVQRQLDRLRAQQRLAASLAAVAAVAAVAWDAVAWGSAVFFLGIAGVARWQRRRWENDPDPVGRYRRSLARQLRSLHVRRLGLKVMLGIFALGFVGGALAGPPLVALGGAAAVGAWFSFLLFMLRREERSVARETAALGPAGENRQTP